MTKYDPNEFFSAERCGKQTMDRLTKQAEDSQAIMDCQRCEMNRADRCIALECRNKLKERLAVYVDAEEQGLLVRLPCKVGDMVWVIRTAAKTGIKSIHKGEVINFMLGTDNVVLVVDYEFYGIEEGYFQWGWNAFATKEEAEMSLAKENENILTSAHSRKLPINEKPIIWCDNQTIDENGVLTCLAHLAEARVFTCPYKDNQERLESQYPCSDYQRREMD